LHSLKEQSVKSIRWTTLQTLLVGFSGPVSLIVKSRFLKPNEFGYLSIVMIVIGLFDLLGNFGINYAIIQKKTITKEESSSLFFFNIIFSFLLALAIYFVAPFVADFYSMPKLDYYLKVVALVVLINGFTLVFKAFLQKQMYFKQLAIINMGRNIIMLVSVIILLSVEFGVLGVIYSHLISTFFTLIAIVFVSIRLRILKLVLYFNFSTIYSFLRFGFFVTTKQLMTFATHRMDEAIIGYFLSPDILGIYHFAKNMLEQVKRLMTRSFGQVLLPLYSRMKNQPSKLSFTYRRISRYIAFIGFPLFAGIAITAHLFVPIVFGDKWIESVIVFQVFSVVLIFLVLTSNVAPSLLYSLNKPRLVLNIDIVINILYLIALFLFSHKGMLAILLSYSFYVIFKTFILQYYANRQLVNSYMSYVRELTIPATSALIMTIIDFVFQLTSNFALDDLFQLLGSIAIGALSYMIVVYIFAPKTLKQLKSALIRGEVPE
jgi:O-antigen/teichoic acid export membrane protein